MKRLVLPAFISFLFLIALWHMLILSFHLPPYLLPSPEQVAFTLIQSFPMMLKATLTTLDETLLGLGLGVVFGISVALILILVRPIRLLVLPLLLLSQAFPTFALAPLFVLWLGFGLSSKIAVVMWMTFFPIASSFFDGLQKTPSSHLEMAQYMRGKPLYILRYIYIPHALPALASGLRVSAVFAPMGAVISEWIGSSQGLGYLMVNANARLETELVFASIIMLIIMTLSLYFLIDRLSRWWISW